MFCVLHILIVAITLASSPALNYVDVFRSKSSFSAMHKRSLLGVTPIAGNMRRFHYYMMELNSASYEDGSTNQEFPLLPHNGFDLRRYRAQLISGSASAWKEQLKRNRNPELADVETWAHELSFPEKGCLLLASPHFAQHKSEYEEAVIFLLRHNQYGSVGLVLNKPTRFKISSISRAMGPLSNCPVLWGGNLSIDTVHMIHGFGSSMMPFAKEIIPGIYTGGRALDAIDLVLDGKALPQDFHFFLQLFGMPSKKLISEIQEGKWYCAATSPELILKSSVDCVVPLWKEVMQLMGGKYALISRAIYDDL